MDLASTRNWANAKRDSTDDSDHIRAIDGLAMLLDHEESPVTAAKIITGAYESHIKETPMMCGGDKVSHFWALYMCDAIRTFGSARERLIELLHEMSREPDVQATDGSLAKYSNGAVYWRDLPGWPLQLCEQALNYNHPADFWLEEADEYFAQAPYLLNACKFTATLFGRGHSIFFLDLSTRADLFLEMGVENLYDDKNDIKSREWKVLLPASVTWLLIAGKTIYKICLDDDDDEGSQVRSGRRLWGKQTWEHWKCQLRRHENRDDIDWECRGLAAQAARAMVQVELEHQG